MIARGGPAVSEYSLGVEAENGQVINLLERGSPLPARTRRLFTTVGDRQTAVDVGIIAGKSSQRFPVGRILLSGISRARRGDPRIEVAMIADRDGIVRVRVRDMDTGAAQVATFSVEPGPSADGVELKGRIFSLITRVREESMALPPAAAALLTEIREVTGACFASIGRNDADEMAGCIAALEAILGEILAIARGHGGLKVSASAPAGGWSASREACCG